MTKLEVGQRYQIVRHKHDTEEEEKYCFIVGHVHRIIRFNINHVDTFNETTNQDSALTDLSNFTFKRLNPKVEVGDLVRITKHEHHSGSCPHIGKERIVETVDALGQAERLQSFNYPFSEWGNVNVEYEIVSRKADEVKLPDNFDWNKEGKPYGSEYKSIQIYVETETEVFRARNFEPTAQDIADVNEYLQKTIHESKIEYMTKWMNTVWPKMDKAAIYDKISVIRAMREDLKLGLKEVKDFVEVWPEFKAGYEKTNQLKQLARELNAVIVWN